MSAPTAPTALETGTARAWWWRTTDTARPADLALLDASDRQRAARMRMPAVAGEFVSCRAAVRRILGPLLGVEPRGIRLGRRPCPGCGSAEHGPPMVVAPRCAWWISIAHSAGAGMLAVADVPVGVDVEGARELPVEELVDVALSPAEAGQLRTLPRKSERTRAFLRCWTRKEAVLKATGVGITADLTAIETQPLRDGPVTVPVDGTPWTVTELGLPRAWAAAIALPADRERTVRLSAHP